MYKVQAEPMSELGATADAGKTALPRGVLPAAARRRRILAPTSARLSSLPHRQSSDRRMLAPLASRRRRTDSVNFAPWVRRIANANVLEGSARDPCP